MSEKLFGTPLDVQDSWTRKVQRRSSWILPFLPLPAALLAYALLSVIQRPPAPANASEILSICNSLHEIPSVPQDFYSRTVSDRFVEGTKATFIRNATIWTGGRDGTELVYGDVLLDGGIVKALGYIPDQMLKGVKGRVNTIDAYGSWVTPGLIDLHSHVGMLSAPLLKGAFDVGSRNGPMVPWMRSLDGFNTRDDARVLAIAGGVTTGLVLPGSGNAVGGQAFPFKFRKTQERSPSSMLIEPPFNLNDTAREPGTPLRWRHMKHATGENQLRYGTRMDSTWAFREGYEEARKIKVAQDEYCAKAKAGLWNDIKGIPFPYSLHWEALVDVLRGRVKVNCHTYEAVDIDFLARLTNEFKFPLAALHHSHEAYLIPDVIKKMWGKPPAVAIFATNARYKREAYRGSEFAPRILADNGIKVVMKSDHPVLDSRYLAYEAQQAHYYSLPSNLALSSITTTPAIAAGLDHRIGYIREGYDADLVIWDSNPLVLGATPKQVFIDGIPQLENPHVNEKPAWLQKVPRTPDFEDEIKATLEYEGLPPLTTKAKSKNVLFLNVQSLWTRQGDSIQPSFQAESANSSVVIVTDGKLSCFGDKGSCATASRVSYDVVDLKGGSISTGLTTSGAPVGLQEIPSEASTNDGALFDPFVGVPPVLGDDGTSIFASDGLQLQGRDTLLAYRSGVTSSVSAWSAGSLFSDGVMFDGISVAFRTGAAHSLDKGAIIKSKAALHISISRSMFGSGPSVSTQIATLRRLLLRSPSDDAGNWFHKAALGEIPLVISVGSADLMANLIRLKKEVESETGSTMKWTFARASEAHLLANEIASSGISILLTRPRLFPTQWDDKRIIPGPPLSADSAISTLLKHNITVGLGTGENWEARNVRFDLAWAALDSGGELSLPEVLKLATVNMDHIFDIERGDGHLDDLVAFEGGTALDLESKVVAIISPEREVVELF
ncbi:hypothetical protein SISSUDRAFT_1064386 [Sistotremastrum suecicum HHB10207 ss-3]|uniref:Amidohydrolase-related domain-containing protein n=1 Tax=Sistotremastrum suecicum HHB10207 ss-3 TaxID=1314776 RepID=A0A166ANX3_9AGAM|nr:hypothetical protein SISSUDRAFT_1064386 [Sistotremastrum suecicum HHB10207 ss-3]